MTYFKECRPSHRHCSIALRGNLVPKRLRSPHQVRNEENITFIRFETRSRRAGERKLRRAGRESFLWASQPSEMRGITTMLPSIKRLSNKDVILNALALNVSQKNKERRWKIPRIWSHVWSDVAPSQSKRPPCIAQWSTPHRPGHFASVQAKIVERNGARSHERQLERTARLSEQRNTTERWTSPDPLGFWGIYIPILGNLPPLHKHSSPWGATDRLARVFIWWLGRKSPGANGDDVLRKGTTDFAEMGGEEEEEEEE